VSEGTRYFGDSNWKRRSSEKNKARRDESAPSAEWLHFIEKRRIRRLVENADQR
jgi:hypothetical protein